MQKHTETSGSV